MPDFRHPIAENPAAVSCDSPNTKHGNVLVIIRVELASDPFLTVGALVKTVTRSNFDQVQWLVLEKRVKRYTVARALLGALF